MAKNSPKTNVFWPKITFLDFPGRVLSNQGRGFPFGENPKIPKNPDPTRPKSPNILVPARRSSLKKAARGCPRIQIWSHEGPKQSQNQGFAHPASRKARAASGLEPRHVLRKQAIFFFSSKNMHPGKTACRIGEICPNF